VLTYDEPLLSYQRKEFQFFQEVTQICLQGVLEKHNLVNVLPHVLKTTTSMLASQYTDINEKLKDRVTQVSVNHFDIPDIFAEDW
jgi:hypothetical protein